MANILRLDKNRKFDAENGKPYASGSPSISPLPASDLVFPFGFLTKLRRLARRGSIQGENSTASDNLLPRMAETLEADIILGMPSRKCMFHGICRIEPVGKMKGQEAISFAQASIQFREPNDLVINFRIASMSEQTIRQHFSKGVFTMLEAVELPTFITEVLGFNHTISPGIYTIEKVERHYRVVFS
ncbi:MAG: hypothetical protein R2828_19300 [Saprospiraceae bacterium]